MARRKGVGLLSPPLATIQREQVLFRGFAGEEARDADGDGLYEALGVFFEVDSIYEGPLYLQAELPGSPRPHFAKLCVSPRAWRGWKSCRRPNA